MKLYAAVLIAVIALLTVWSEASTPTMAATFESQVVTKTKVTTRKVTHRTKRGTKHIYTKTRIKTRPIRHKTWHTGRKVVSRTKKIFN